MFCGQKKQDSASQTGITAERDDINIRTFSKLAKFCAY